MKREGKGKEGDGRGGEAKGGGGTVGVMKQTPTLNTLRPTTQDSTPHHQTYSLNTVSTNKCHRDKAVHQEA